MSRYLTVLLATLGSAALLGGAFLFQAFGYPPCAMCIWQRWPHGIAIAVGLIALETYRWGYGERIPKSSHHLGLWLSMRLFHS